MSIEPSDPRAVAPGSIEDRLRIVVDFAGACPWRLFPSENRMDWEADPEPFMGWPADQLREWTSLLQRAHPDDRPALEAVKGAPAETGQVHFRLEQPDGTWRWLSLQGRWIANGAGRFIYGVVSNETERQTELRRSRMLLAELQHRIKNMVAVIRSMAHRTRETSADLDEFSAHFEGRLGAFVRTHSALARTDRGEIDLEEIIREELRVNASPDDEPWTLSGPTVHLRQKTAELMTLAIHELAINAVKYGALSTPEGRIEIRWSLSDDETRLFFDWVERGGAPVHAAEKRGFGRELIEQALPYQLGAHTELTFDREGVRCHIEVAFDRAPAP